MVGNSCKDCMDRELGCHVTCERYIAFQKSRKAELDARHKDNINHRKRIPTTLLKSRRSENSVFRSRKK